LSGFGSSVVSDFVAEDNGGSGVLSTYVTNIISSPGTSCNNGIDFNFTAAADYDNGSIITTLFEGEFTFDTLEGTTMGDFVQIPCPSSSETDVTGDMNQDGMVNINDIIIIVNIILGNSDFSSEELIIADVVVDGLVNVEDIVYLVNIILGNWVFLNKFKYILL